MNIVEIDNEAQMKFARVRDYAYAGLKCAARSEIATVGQNRARSSKLVENFMSAAPNLARRMEKCSSINC